MGNRVSFFKGRLKGNGSVRNSSWRSTENHKKLSFKFDLSGEEEESERPDNPMAVRFESLRAQDSYINPTKPPIITLPNLINIIKKEVPKPPAPPVPPQAPVPAPPLLAPGARQSSS